MVPKSEIRVTRWDDRRDGIIYNIHWYSNGTRWYERVGRLDSKRSKHRLTKDWPKASGDQGSTKKGQEFENDVAKLVNKVVGANLLVRRLEPVMGSAGPWEADIVISESGDFRKSGVIGQVRAIVECKYSGKHVSPGSYVTGLARGYMHLNDIRNANENVRLFLAVNRLPTKGENPRDTRVLLDRIGVSLVNFEDGAERERFSDEIANLRLN